MQKHTFIHMHMIHEEQIYNLNKKLPFEKKKNKICQHFFGV